MDSNSTAAAPNPSSGKDRKDRNTTRSKSRSRSRSRDHHSRRHHDRRSSKSRSASRSHSREKSSSSAASASKPRRTSPSSKSPKKKKNHSRSRSPRKHSRHSRSRSRSRSRDRSRRHRSRSRSRSRSSSRDRKKHSKSSSSSSRKHRSRSRSRDRRSRSRERRDRNAPGGGHPLPLPPPPFPHQPPHFQPHYHHNPPTHGHHYPHHPPHGAPYQNQYQHHPYGRGPAYQPPPHMQSHEPHRQLHLVTREQREQRDREQRHQSNPLQRPPPPPPTRPAPLMSHVLPSSKGKYAYVFLVMKGDSYASGAIIGAYSLKCAGTKHSTVCMVTPDVTEECRARMRIVFTEVVEIPYLKYEVKPLRTQKQRSMYNNWVADAFTKWNMLTLIQYEKTLFVDADKICIGNMDHLFEDMNAPSGTFSSPWSHPFVGRKEAIALKKNGGVPVQDNKRSQYRSKKGMPNPYEHCQHNDRVDSDMIYRALTEQSFVVIGTVVLLSPSLEDYEQYKAMLTTLLPFGFEHCHSMMDEQSLSYYFGIYKNYLISKGQYGKLAQEVYGGSSTVPSSLSFKPSAEAIAPVVLPAGACSEWSYIHHCYNYVPWHRYWLTETEVPYTFHFFNLKPWDLHRTEYIDLEAWWELVMAMLSDDKISASDREELSKIYKKEMLDLPKNQGCCWCKFSEESLYITPDGNWKNHNVFDERGRLQCKHLIEGFDRDTKRRQATKESAASSSSSSR